MKFWQVSFDGWYSWKSIQNFCWQRHLCVSPGTYWCTCYVDKETTGFASLSDIVQIAALGNGIEFYVHMMPHQNSHPMASEKTGLTSDRNTLHDEKRQSRLYRLLMELWNSYPTFNNSSAKLFLLGTASLISMLQKYWRGWKTQFGQRIDKNLVRIDRYSAFAARWKGR